MGSAILRLVEHEGVVSLDSIPSDRLIDYRTHVTAMPQQTHIFHTSVAENLRLAAPDASETQLLRALDRAGLTQWFGTLPQGLATMLGYD